MRTQSFTVAALVAAALITGCTTPSPTSPTSAAADTPAAAASQPKAEGTKVAEKPGTTAPAVSADGPALTPPPMMPMQPPKLSPETTALVERLTQNYAASGALPHEVTTTTGFPSAMNSLEAGAPAPQVESVDVTGQPPVKGLTADGNTTALFEKDWTGLVLVPISTSLSKAYTSDVRLMKVEAHPLNDGRVRIWTRVHNIGNESLPAEIACEFRMGSSQANSPYFYPLVVPAKSFRDVFFVSPEGSLSAYTVLVRSTEALNSRR